MSDEYSCLSISREEFREIYKDLPILEYEDLFYTEPQSDVEVLSEFLPSKLWRLNNIYTIIDKWGNRIRFRMNRAQHVVYAESLRHPRLIILKSRQQGISTLWLVSFFDDAVTTEGYSVGLMAQGQDEASTLLERVGILWDFLDPAIKAFWGIRIIKDNTKEFALSNRSNIFIRTSFRSTTLQRLHISEMGKIANKYPEKAKETKSGTLQALAQGNIGVVESTAEGDNLFKNMWDNSVTYAHALSLKDFKPVFLSWIDDPDCQVDAKQEPNEKQAKYFAELEEELDIKLTQKQKNFWLVQWRELGDKVYQEYPSTATEAFMATKQGAYWAQLYMDWIKKHGRDAMEDLYDPNLDVEVAVDLGMDDTNVLMPFQTYRGDQFRHIDEFCDNGQEIKYYCDWMKRRPWFKNLTRVILPHDAEVKELTSGKKRWEVFEEELAFDRDGNPTGIFVDVLPKTDSVNEDIEQVRQIIKNVYIDKNCDYVRYSYLNYKKEWDDRRERWRDKPEKNEAEHGASTIRYMVTGGTRGTNYSKNNKSAPRRPNHRTRRSSGDFDV